MGKQTARTSNSKQFLSENQKIYRPIKHDPSSDYITQSNIKLRKGADMNDIFVPIKCT